MTRVIVIDDHAFLRETVAELLGNESDVAVVGCADGAAAVELTERLAPDVVVMDVQMRGGDGVAVVREVLRRRPGVRVVLLTALPHGRLAAEACAAGAQVCLAKSGRYSALVAAVRGVADQRPAGQ